MTSSHLSWDQSGVTAVNNHKDRNVAKFKAFGPINHFSTLKRKQEHHLASTYQAGPSCEEQERPLPHHAIKILRCVRLKAKGHLFKLAGRAG